jgi:mRNA-degrading endonuclease RelE of RelBE toxin-antitoxin system
MPWQVQITAHAERDLRSLPRSDEIAVRDAIDRLAVDASSVDLRKLAGKRSEWRVRVGRWRVRLFVEGAVAYVERVLPRKEAYRE